ncbi:MAG: toprim domain-containing protein [Chthoniobacterales bacterium]|nr:toprim domain-containing protein [Chthoniobacterales bacterium]
MAERYDPLEVKRRLPFLDVLAHEGVPVRRSGPNYVATCPFHQERSASFTVYVGSDPAEDHAFCFGCGWPNGKPGDVIGFYQAKRGVDFAVAIAQLASLGAVPPSVKTEWRARENVSRMTASKKQLDKPALPQLRTLNEDEQEQLAKLRGLSVEGVAAACEAKRVAFCPWPAWEPQPCWLVTDSARYVAQFRRLDGAMFVRHDGREIKCWSKGSPTWPLGAGEIGEQSAVLLVEGGADMLAGYHFLEGFGRLEQVAVCAVLGASMRLAVEALPYFYRKRVRIVLDDDEAGTNAAARWTEQLTEAGAAVESFSLSGLTTKEGLKVKDLNDLALVEESAWLDPELKAAFLDWDF